MTSEFNSEEAIRFLKEREKKEKEAKEMERKRALEKAIGFLKKEFQNSQVEVYLVGSITRPYAFSSRSDIDIVLRNFQGDRFEFWSRAEKELDKPVEIILFENCSFAEYVLKEGMKVI